MDGNSKRMGRMMDLLCDIVGSLFYATGIYTFAKMADFAPGGISGLALLMNHLWSLPIGIMTLALNIPCVLLSWKVVGKEFLKKTARTMIICTVVLDILFPMTPAYSGSPSMAALYSGVFMGIGMALFYMRGSSSGGTDFLTMTIKALYPHFSIGAVTMGIDLVVIALGGLVFGNVDAVLYGLAATFVASVVIDKLMYGMSAGALAIVITTRGEEVARRIGEIIDRGSTSIPAVGTYTGAKRDVLLCACSKSQAYIVQRAAQETDPQAFVMMTETSQVYGEGFIEAAVDSGVSPGKKQT